MTTEIGALIVRMTALLEELESAADPARFFLGTYLRTTVAVGAALERGFFEDAAWVTAWDVDFADLYLDALTAYRRDPATAAQPWRRAFAAGRDLPPEAHVLLGMNAHINYDLPQSLIRMIPVPDFEDPELVELRHRDHVRIDRVLASRVSAEDVALQGVGGRRTPLDRTLAPLNRWASRIFLREARRRVWATTTVLHEARRRGRAHYEGRLYDLESVSADRIEDILRPGPVLLRLAVRGFGVTLPPH